MNETLKQSTRAIILVLLQVLVFSHFNQFDYGIAFIYLFFILFLPISIKKWQLLLIAFFTGFLVDLFTGTYGLNALSITFLAFIREYLLRFFVRQYKEDENDEFRLYMLKNSQYFLYTFFASLIYCVVFFIFDYFTFSSLVKLSFQILYSTLFTFLTLFIYRFLFAKISEPKN